MTEKENYLKVMNGEQPEWVPNLPAAVDLIPPFITISHMATEEKIDYFGVHWLVNDAGGIADTTQPPVLKDISDWRSHMNLPDLETFDWEGITQFELKDHDPDKAIGLLIGLGGGAFFIPLMNMMGFEEGLCAMVEDPDEVKALFEYMYAYYEKLLPLCVKYYKPDVIVMGDDLCTALGSFISFDTYEALLKPLYQKLIDMVHSYGVFYELHMCGKCEVYVEDMLKMGIDSWQTAQGLNDLKGLKAKYGNRLVFCGTWSTNGPGGIPGATEDVVRQEVRKCMDELAEGGGMVFWHGGPVGSSKDQTQKLAWADDEAYHYGHAFYQKKG